MRYNHEITKEQRLLDASGNIAEPGYAKKLLWQYDRNDIKAAKIRIKEWDYYYIGNQDYGVCLTISDSAYTGCIALSFLKFADKPYDKTASALSLFPMGKMNLPASSVQGDIKASFGGADFTFENDGKTRHLYGSYKNFPDKGDIFDFDFLLSDIPEESMVIATPFDKKKHFYYNQKINCMKVDGFATFKGEKILFNKDNGSLATLDWGRGVWTYDNTWYWGSGQTYLEDGSTFGFNIGGGFGNTSCASENMLFYNGKSHKLDDVVFNIPQDEKGNFLYLEPWSFFSTDGRFEMIFKPVLDRQAPLNVGVLMMMPHQVFGKMSGTAILDDGTPIEIKDVMVFAERVHNKW